MNQKSNFSNQTLVNLLMCVLLISFVNLGCTDFRRPWRDYTPQPFDSQQWLDGDTIERGRMIQDIFMKRVPEKKSKDEITKLFGKPDKQTTIEGREVWMYRVNLGVAGSDLNMFPISFEPNGRAFAGSVKDGTMSMLIEEN